MSRRGNNKRSERNEQAAAARCTFFSLFSARYWNIYSWRRFLVEFMMHGSLHLGNQHIDILCFNCPRWWLNTPIAVSAKHRSECGMRQMFGVDCSACAFLWNSRRLFLLPFSPTRRNYDAQSLSDLGRSKHPMLGIEWIKIKAPAGISSPLVTSRKKWVETAREKQVGEMCSRWDFSFVHACSSARPRSHPGRFLIAPLFSAVIAERPLPTLQVIKKRKKNDRKTFTNTSATSCAGGEWEAVGHIYCLLARCFSFAQKVDFCFVLLFSIYGAFWWERVLQLFD